MSSNNEKTIIRSGKRGDLGGVRSLVKQDPGSTPMSELRYCRLAWCRIEHGSVALMLQQFRTEGKNARVFEGQRGKGVRLACLQRGDDSGWPHHGQLTEMIDPDGYVLLASKEAFTSGTAALRTVVLVLDVVNIVESMEYYIGELGFRETDRWASNGETTRCRLTCGSGVVLLQAMSREQRQSLGQSDRLGQGVTISLVCDDAIAFYRAMSSRGTAVNEPYVGNRFWCVGFTDPDGYRIAFESPANHPEETTLSEIEAQR